MFGLAKLRLDRRVSAWDSHPFNLHTEKWFEGYSLNSTQIFIGCHLRFFWFISTFQNFFKMPTVKKIWVEATLKKSQVAASDRPNVRFGRTSTVRFDPNDRTFFCRTQNFFSSYYYIQCQWHPFIFLFCFVTHMYASLSLVFR